MKEEVKGEKETGKEGKRERGEQGHTNSIHDSTIHDFRGAYLLTYILYGLFILSCVVLVVSVLLQPGKADAGALFSSSVSSTAFGPRGTQSILSKITIGACAAFMLLALMLSLPAITGQRSVLQSAEPESESAPVTQPSPTATQAPSPAASPATSPGASAAPASAAPSPSAQK